MSNSFAGIATFGYRGATFRLPVKLPQGVNVPANQVPPSVCPVTIDWNVYWQLAGNPANVAVFVNLQAASVQASILDRIASVKIDNTGSPNAVYVVFEDSGDVINCPPNCSVTFPCLTNLLNAKIVALGLVTGFIPTTRIFFYNIPLPPAVDFEISQSVQLQKASPVITRGTTIFNTNFGVPALGDQFHSSGGLNITVVGAPPVPLWNTPYASGFIYLTNFQMMLNRTDRSQTTNGLVFVESTGVAGGLLNLQFSTGNDGANSTAGADKCLLNMAGCQVKLDATQQWQMRNGNTVGSGVINAYSCFTHSPI
jgi:hypothetical protein